MTKKQIANAVSSIAGFPASVVDVDYILFDAHVSACDVESIFACFDHLVLRVANSYQISIGFVAKYIMVDTIHRV